MPLYLVKCNKCSEETEVLVKISDKLVCPKCDSDDVVKLLTTFSTYNIKGDNSSSNTPKRYQPKSKIVFK